MSRDEVSILAARARLERRVPGGILEAKDCALSMTKLSRYPDTTPTKKDIVT
jgi:hypothetical protein